METRRSHDVQDTERVFKKVVYPGLETLKVVDRNGVPQVNYPGVPVNSFRSKSFILSPRGVPMKTTNHVYSGCQAHPAKVSDLVDNGHGPDTIYGTEKSFGSHNSGTHSAKVPRKRNESPLQQQKRAATSLSQATPQHFSNSASSGHFLTGEPSERRVLQSANSNYFNLSNQGLRLQREWTSLSNSRSMKRASNIVNHRVDRMYFMSGNSIQLKPRYDVDEDELKKMKEQQAKNKQTAHKRVHVKRLKNFHVVMLPNGDNSMTNLHEDYNLEGHKNEEAELICLEDQMAENQEPVQEEIPPPQESQCQIYDYDEENVRHTVSIESGIPEVEIKAEDINYGIEDLGNEEEQDNIKGPVNVLDILSQKDQWIFGRCMIELMKNAHEEANKENVFQKKKPKFFPARLKRIGHKPKKIEKKSSFSDILGSPSLNRKNFPRQKKNISQKKTGMEPVNCDCRKYGYPNSLELMVNGAQIPFYQPTFGRGLLMGSRTSSRNSLKGNNKQKEPIDIQKKLQPGSEVTGDTTTSSEVNLKKPDGTISPIQGWDAKDKAITEENVIIRQKSLHDGEENVPNGDTTDDIDENMRADGRIDGFAVNKPEDNSEENKVEVTEQEEGEECNDVKGETNDDNVAQDNT